MRAIFCKRAAIGFPIGVAVGLLAGWLTRGDGAVLSPEYTARWGGLGAALAVQLLASGLYGALCMGATVIYEIDRWPQALATALHFLCVAIPFIPLALLLGWGEGVGDILIMEGFQLAAYFVIWLVMYLRCKAQVRELNEMQRHLRRGEPPEESDAK